MSYDPRPPTWEDYFKPQNMFRIRFYCYATWYIYETCQHEVEHSLRNLQCEVAARGEECEHHRTGKLEKIGETGTKPGICPDCDMQNMLRAAGTRSSVPSSNPQDSEPKNQGIDRTEDDGERGLGTIMENKPKEEEKGKGKERESTENSLVDRGKGKASIDINEERKGQGQDSTNTSKGEKGKAKANTDTSKDSNEKGKVIEKTDKDTKIGQASKKKKSGKKK